MHRVSLILTFAGVLLGHSLSQGQTSYPMLTHSAPGAVERGKTSEIVVHAKQNIDSAFAVYVEGDGVKAEVVPPPADKKGKPANSVTLRVTVAPEATLGIREFRLATAQGVSTVGQLVLSDVPVIAETGEHATIDKALPIEINRMVCGSIANREQVDVYKFTAQEGQQVVFSICSARLMTKVHDLQTHFDPIVSVHDASGRELAADDDYYFADSMLAFRFPKAGQYFVTVRDVRYSGDPRWAYSMLVTDRPYVTAIDPMAVARSGDWKVSAVGFNLRESQLEVPLASGAALGPHPVQFKASGSLSQPVVVEVTDLPIQREAEPNDGDGKVNRLSLPVGIAGRIERTSDVDQFAFAVKKGMRLRFEVKARRNGSSLDSHLRLLNAKGGVVAENDDHKNTKDSLLSVAIPADGAYVLQCRDLLYRGGPTFGYFLEATIEEPGFELVCDDDKGNLGPGVGAPWFVRATRVGGFAGPIQVRVEGLPAGATVNPLTIPPTMTEGCLSLQAAPGAKMALSAAKVVGRAEVAGLDEKPRTIERTALPYTEIYVPGGGRALADVGTQVIQIQQEFDLASVKVTPERLQLKPGEQATLEVEIVRRDNYKGAVTLDVLLRHLGRVFGNPLPPGVTVVEKGAKTSLGPTETKGKIILKADASAAPIENVPVVVMANVSINFVVKRAYASKVVLVSVGDAKKTIAAANAQKERTNKPLERSSSK